MNESELKRYCLEHAGESLPAEAEALLNRDPELKKQVEQLIAVSRLMSLKKYEQPDTACMQRCIQAVNARIEERQSGGLLYRIREWFTFEVPASQYAYAAAALAVCAVGVGLLLGTNSPEGVTVAAQETQMVQPQVIPEPVEMKVETVAAIVEPEPEPVVQVAEIDKVNYTAFDKPLIVLRVETNPQPSQRMYFGTPQSVPVSFDY